MNYLDVLKNSEDMVSPGISACQGCGAELIMRRVLQVAGKNTIVAIPPGCMAGAGAVGWNYANGLKIPVHIPASLHTVAYLSSARACSESLSSSLRLLNLPMPSTNSRTGIGALFT